MAALRHTLLSSALGAALILLDATFRVSAAATTASSPWAQAWPMVGHDPQRTNRSPLAGPIHPRLLFMHAAAAGLSPVVGPDDSIYIWSREGLLALDVAGHERWLYHAGADSPPALAPDGRVIVNASTASRSDVDQVQARAVLAIGPDGRLAWKVQPSAFSKLAPPLVTADGFAYVPYVGPTGTNARLDAISPVGQVRRLQPGFSFGAVARARNGSLYAIGRYSSHEGLLVVERLSPSGKVLWRRPLQHQGFGLLIGQYGTIYVSDGENVGYSGTTGLIAAYTASGRRLWRLRTSDGAATLALRTDGTLLAAGQLGLSAISPKGILLWHATLGRSGGNAVPSIAVDARGTGYVGSGDGVVRIISRTGRLWGRIRVGPPSMIETPAEALGPGSRFVVVGTDSTLQVYGPRETGKSAP